MREEITPSARVFDLAPRKLCNFRYCLLHFGEQKSKTLLLTSHLHWWLKFTILIELLINIFSGASFPNYGA
jgi:hypothetical protein